MVVAQQVAERQLYRSRDAHLAGVCAGIAEYCDFDPIVIRILAVLLTLSTFGLAAIVYLILWAYLPRASETRGLYEVMPEGVESSAYGKMDYESAVGVASNAAGNGPSLLARLAIAVFLMLVFMVVAINVTPLLSSGEWWQFWPLVLLMAGLCLTVIPMGGKHATAWHAVGIVVMSVGASLLPMSLGVVSWETVPYAFSQLWVFVAVSVILFVLGYVRNVGPLMVAAALCFVAFCLISLLVYGVAGDASLVLIVP